MFTSPKELTDSHKKKEMSVEELLALRAEIEEALPARHLKDLDLEKELVFQFLQVKTLQADTMSDDEAPANQKAQVANACASTLGQLAKAQSEIYSAERMKAVEQILIRTLRRYPELAAAFLADYTVELGAV